MLEDLAARVNAQPMLVRRGRFLDMSFGFAIGDEARVVHIEKGQVTSLEGQDPVFTFRTNPAAWAEFSKPVPKRKFHDVMALVEYGEATLEGDIFPFMVNMYFFKGVIESAKQRDIPQ
ncbi:hypothetical protein [Zavarzinia sp. CC-PAN008]|uniref:hypothetical protein n=1 Tax=Zavarzinia sp. CC-PAN008 TaxID=3243332 RepID=UPI003F7440FF